MRSITPPKTCRLHAGWLSRRRHTVHTAFAIILPTGLIFHSVVADGATFPPNRRTIDRFLGAELVDGKGPAGIGGDRRVKTGGVGGVDNIFEANTYKRKSISSKGGRACDTEEERYCYKPCKEKCGKNEKACLQMCRKKCCKRESHSDKKDEKPKADKSRDDNKKEGEKDGSDANRLCNTKKEKACRILCFDENACDQAGEACRKKCRMQCCDHDEDKKGGGKGEPDITNEDFFNYRSNEGEEDDTKADGGDKEKNNGDGSHEDENIDKTSQKIRYNPTAKLTVSPTLDKDAFPTFSPTKAPSVVFSPDGEMLVSEDLGVFLDFNITISLDLTAETIISGRGNTIKADIEAGMGLLVAEIVGEAFDQRRKRRLQLKRRQLTHFHLSEKVEIGMLTWQATEKDKRQHSGMREQRHGQRKLVVRVNTDVPPTIIGAKDMDCPDDLLGRACIGIIATVTLTLVDEDKKVIQKIFNDKMLAAIKAGRLDAKIKYQNPNSTIASYVVEEHGESADSRSDGGSTTRKRTLIVVLVVVGLILAIPTLVYCFRPLFAKDRERRKEPTESVDGSFPKLEGDVKTNVRVADETTDLAYDLSQIDVESCAAPSAEEEEIDTNLDKKCSSQRKTGLRVSFSDEDCKNPEYIYTNRIKI